MRLHSWGLLPFSFLSYGTMQPSVSAHLERKGMPVWRLAALLEGAHLPTSLSALVWLQFGPALWFCIDSYFSGYWQVVHHMILPDYASLFADYLVLPSSQFYIHLLAWSLEHLIYAVLLPVWIFAVVVFSFKWPICPFYLSYPSVSRNHNHFTYFFSFLEKNTILDLP